jgi:hypothetical protein
MKHSHQVFGSRLLNLTLGVTLLLTPSLHAQTSGQSVSGASPISRITQIINEQSLIRLTGNTPSFISKATDLGVAPDSLELKHMQFVLKRSDAQEAALKQFLKEQQQPGSANYHQWLTPEEFGEKYGVSESDLAKITGWLSSHGFSIENVSNGRTVIEFSGTHEQLRAAFHTELHQYSIRNEKDYANASDPMIPAALAPVVSGFSALTSYGPKPLHTAPQLMKRKAGGTWQKMSVAPQIEGAAGTKPSPRFTTTIEGSNAYLISPSDFATIYDVAPLWNQSIDGTGQTIAIVAQSDVNPSDVDAFRSAFGLPAKKLNVIYAGDDPGLTADSVESEAALDVEWSGAMAKNATIDMVVAAQTATGGGVDLASEYAVDNNLAPILSVSWGECELGLGVSGNEYYYGLWQQAAAEGITVLVAAGDSGSASCDQNGEVAESGEQVSGFASTPYNTAVGGTDFSINFTNASQYWNTTNDPTTLASVKSYIPETPWNDSCASPEVLTAAQQAFGATDTTNEAFCNDFEISEEYGFINVVGGGGGASNCTTSDGNSPSSCTGGYPTPDWQLQMPGMPSNGVRNVPDVSFFAGNGIWGSSYVFCQSDATPDGVCNYQNGDVEYLTSGGTSFAAPAFAGVVALMNQKSQTALGNINYALYQLGATQYGGNGAAVFNDITTGSNAEPCLIGTLALPPSTPCPITNPDDEIGILPGYGANVGYDDASGLGSIDVAKMADAWTAAISGLKTTTTTLALSGAATVTYGTPISVQIQVAAGSGTQVPTGGAALFDEDTSAGTPLASVQLSGGGAKASGNRMPAGAHKLYARYAGDGTFAASSSTPIPVTITQAATTMAFTASHANITAGQSVSFEINLETKSTASSPTGTVTVTDATTGKQLSSISVSAQTDATTGASIGHAFLNVSGQQLASGANTITASYAGDGNYTASSSTTSVSYTGPFSVNLGAASLTLAPGATSGNTIAVTITPNSGTTLDPASLFFSCPETLPQGLTCSFSAPVTLSNGSVTSTLTIILSSPLIPQSNVVAWYGAGSMTGLACLFMLGLPGRRRRLPLVVALCTATVFAFAVGCSGSSTKIQANSSATNTVLSTSSDAPALGSPVALTAAISGGNGSANGTMTFLDGANTLGTATVIGGKATYSIIAGHRHALADRSLRGRLRERRLNLVAHRDRCNDDGTDYCTGR